MNYLAWLASSLDPPYLSFPCTWGYRYEPPHLYVYSSLSPNSILWFGWRSCHLA
jgi:hypothetical protein